MIRNRKRYIAFKITSNSKFDPEGVEKAILKGFSQFLGEFETSKAHPVLLKEHWKNNTGVLKINHDYIPKTKVVLALIKEIEGKNVIFQTFKVFGTLKKIRA